MLTPPLCGLVLAGGHSTRMGVDKGTLAYVPSGEDQRTRCARLLSAHCTEVFISCREPQAATLGPGLRPLVDLPSLGDVGPAAGLVTAYFARQHCAWLVLAVDFPLLDESGLAELVSARDPGGWTTCFVHPDGTPEPLLTIWEPEGLAALAEAPSRGARQALGRGPSTHLRPSNRMILVNVNTPGDFPVRPEREAP